APESRRAPDAAHRRIANAHRRPPRRAAQGDGGGAQERRRSRRESEHTRVAHDAARGHPDGTRRTREGLRRRPGEIEAGGPRRSEARRPAAPPRVPGARRRRPFRREAQAPRTPVRLREPRLSGEVVAVEDVLPRRPRSDGRRARCRAGVAHGARRLGHGRRPRITRITGEHVAADYTDYTDYRGSIWPRITRITRITGEASGRGLHGLRG